MSSGLFFTIRRGQYYCGLQYQTVAQIVTAIGASTVKNGDEIMDGNGQGRFGVVSSGSIVLTSS